MKQTLEITNLSKNYGEFQLDDISFSLPTGYIMGLIGPNGLKMGRSDFQGSGGSL